MFRIAICDDSEQECQREKELTMQILRTRKVDFFIKTYTDPEKLEEDILKGQECFQLLLLDILMDEVNGVSFAGKLRRQHISAEIIFVTTCPDFALESFAVDALQYLLKPVDRENLERALERALKRWNALQPMLLVETRGGSQIIPVDKIEYFEIFSHTIQIHHMHGVVTCNGSLTEMEKRLPAGRFCRCHKSFLVNLSKIREIQRKSVFLENGKELPVGRSSYLALHQSFISYAEGY